MKDIKNLRTKIEILDDTITNLEEKVKYYGQSYQIIGQEEYKKYNKETNKYELVYDEDGSVIMRDIYDYVDIPESEISESDIQKINACKEIIETLQSEQFINMLMKGK